MLTELKNVTQEKYVPGYRRWFYDDEFDLIVWYTPVSEIFGFQLCYDISNSERAFTWKQGQPLMHTGVDSGEQSPLFNRSPLLVSDRNVNVAEVLGKFQERSAQLEPAIAHLVLSTILGFNVGEAPAVRE